MGEALTISPRTVNTAHVTVMRRRNNRGYAPNDINAATLGITLYQAEPNGLQLTITRQIHHRRRHKLGLPLQRQHPGLDDDVTWLRGKHQFVFGGEWVQNQLNIIERL